MEFSNNLTLSSSEHLEYLLNKLIISHEGNEGSQVTSRAINNGATALSFGEVIGYSSNFKDLFSAWENSPQHKKIILSPEWNWIGYSLKTTDDNIIICVVNFSSGNLGSTKIIESDGNIYLSGKYLDDFFLEGDFNLLDLKVHNNIFNAVIKPIEKNSVFLYVYDKKHKITDRIDFFFKKY